MIVMKENRYTCPVCHSKVTRRFLDIYLIAGIGVFIPLVAVWVVTMSQEALVLLVITGLEVMFYLFFGGEYYCQKCNKSFAKNKLTKNIGE